MVCLVIQDMVIIHFFYGQELGPFVNVIIIYFIFSRIQALALYMTTHEFLWKQLTNLECLDKALLEEPKYSSDSKDVTDTSLMPSKISNKIYFSVLLVYF